jgi:hypothetical protein
MVVGIFDELGFSSEDENKSPAKQNKNRLNTQGLLEVVRPGGLELPTFWFVARRSIQLSYGRTAKYFTVNSLR